MRLIIQWREDYRDNPRLIQWQFVVLAGLIGLCLWALPSACATHEPSPQAVSALRVSVANAEGNAR